MLDLSDSSETTIFYQKDLFSSGFPMMENIRREGKLCDVTLTVGEHSLSAHRIVLAANIPYFRAMFTHNMVESRQSTIPMSCIDSSALESLVNFAYTGRVSISTSNVQNLMMGASFLQLSRVRDACAEFLQVTSMSDKVAFVVKKKTISPNNNFLGAFVSPERAWYQAVCRHRWQHESGEVIR